MGWCCNRRFMTAARARSTALRTVRPGHFAARGSRRRAALRRETVHERHTPASGRAPSRMMRASGYSVPQHQHAKPFCPILTSDDASMGQVSLPVAIIRPR